MAKPLIELPLTRACILKWTSGRAAHGEAFEGDPLQELFEECLDAINYTEEAEMQGTNMGTLCAQFTTLALEVQNIYLKRELARKQEGTRDARV